MNGLGKELEQIRRRQAARFLKHLERTGQLTPGLRSDVLRSFGFIFEDVAGAIVKDGQGKEKQDDGAN